MDADGIAYVPKALIPDLLSLDAFASYDYLGALNAFAATGVRAQADRLGWLVYPGQVIEVHIQTRATGA